MKKMKIFGALFLSFVILGSILVYGETITKTIQVAYRNITINANGKRILTDHEPFIYLEHVFVPLRLISEALNKKIDWDNNKNQINISDVTPDNKKFLSFPLHKIGERVEAYPFALTVNKIYINFKNRNGDYNVDITLQNISKETLQFRNWTAFCLFDNNGNKFRCYDQSINLGSNTINTDRDVISLKPGEITSKSAVGFRNEDVIRKKTLVLVFEPFIVEKDALFPPAEKLNVFMAFDLGVFDPVGY
jgi:hypothetical protein